MDDIQEFFRSDPKRKADFRELIHKRDDKYDVAVTFSSVLEMMKQRRVDAEQKYLFGDITVTAAEELFAENGSTELEAAGDAGSMRTGSAGGAGDAGSMRTGIAGGAGDAGNTGKGEE